MNTATLGTEPSTIKLSGDISDPKRACVCVGGCSEVMVSICRGWGSVLWSLKAYQLWGRSTRLGQFFG